MPMVREMRRGFAVPSAHTYAASIHEVNQSRARGCRAAAAAYVVLPSITAIKFVANLGEGL